MKKRTLLAALLIVPMGIAIAYETKLGTQSATEATKCVPGQPILGTQGITGYTTCEGEATLGTQSGEITTGGRGTDVYTREGQERVRMQRANVR